ncbi:glycosyltransferase family 1 protein [Planctomycetales bacterium ZRK34]|nr:glycosyltransferase family 1 protein [Planctomycetales bacterium ZRK34]
MRLLFLLQPGTNSRSIFQDLIAGCRALGHDVLIFELEPIWSLSQRAPQQRTAVQGDISRMLATFIQNNKIDLTIGMWANALTTLGLVNHNGKVVTLFDAIEHPHLMIWLDSPERANDGSIVPLFGAGVMKSPWLFHFINNTGTAAEMTELFGFNPDTVLPSRYGINPEVFCPQPDAASKRYDIMFSAGGGDRWQTPTPLMLDQVKSDEPDLDAIRTELAKQVNPKLDVISQNFDAATRPAVREVMTQLMTMQVERRDMPMVDRLNLIRRDDSLTGAVTTFTSRHNLYVQATQAIRSIEHFARAFSFVYLSRFFNCGMFGSADFSAWGCEVKSAGFVDYDKQAAVYDQAHLGLSVMRWQDEVGIHIKPMEIAASGVAPLAWSRRGLGDLYTPGKEIVTYEGLSEAREKVSALLADPTGLSALAESAYQRTLRDHTWSSVCAELLSKIGAVTGRWNSPASDAASADSKAA